MAPARFRLGPRVDRAARLPSARGRKGGPGQRPLWIYTLDPSQSRLDGAHERIYIPYEKLRPGPTGARFAVDSFDHVSGVRYRAANLDEPGRLIDSGHRPSPTDPCFHQQMVYAVSVKVYESFRTALGRDLAWGFDRGDCGDDGDGDDACLRLLPHAFEGQNAYYDKARGEIRFGYFHTRPTGDEPTRQHAYVFTCLSHDVIAHEVTHALLDGIRSHFTLPSYRDVLAFHESFADVIALLHHFSYREVVRAALRKPGANFGRAEMLFQLAREFGAAVDENQPGLRTAVDLEEHGEKGELLIYDNAGQRPHELGRVLTRAVFDAFITIFKRRTNRYLRLAGTRGDRSMSGELREILADEAAKVAQQFLSIVIRAIDYCPPVDLRFGEFLRAILTADRDLVPDDPLAYREAWVDAFRRRRIFIADVPNLSEDALMWQPPGREFVIPALAFEQLKFHGDPAHPAGVREVRRQAEALGKAIMASGRLGDFGLAAPGDPALGGDKVEPPVIESIRSSRRVGPDRQLQFDLIAEITQVRHVGAESDAPGFPFLGGATVVIDPFGRVRYVIVKRITAKNRLGRQRRYLSEPALLDYWQRTNEGDGDRIEPKPSPFHLLHDDS